jgi:hypothetical protein
VPAGGSERVFTQARASNKSPPHPVRPALRRQKSSLAAQAEVFARCAPSLSSRSSSAACFDLPDSVNAHGLVEALERDQAQVLKRQLFADAQFRDYV